MSDPGWEAITYMKQFIVDKIKACYQQFISDEHFNETPSNLFYLKTQYNIYLLIN